MKGKRALFGSGLASGSAALILYAHLLGGCMTSDGMDNPDDTTTHNLFPEPLGENMIPLELLPAEIVWK